MAVRRIAHPSIDDRKEKGLEARDQAPLSSHTKWRPAAGRPDPVALLQEHDATREPDVVPVRHGTSTAAQPHLVAPDRGCPRTGSAIFDPLTGWRRRLCRIDKCPDGTSWHTLGARLKKLFHEAIGSSLGSCEA
jgi:hypothetical protein